MKGALLVLCLAACGRLGFDDQNPATGSGSDPGTPRLVPEVCGMQAWTQVTAVADMNLAVASTPTGASIFGVPTGGGALSGFEIDTTGTLVGNPQGAVIRNDAAYTASAAAYVDSTVIVAVELNTRVLVNIVPAGLGGYSEIANIDGEFVSKDALMYSSADRITPTACSGGLAVNPYDGAWSPQTVQLSVTTAQSTGIDATPLGSDALVVWSTATDCHVERVTDMKTGTGSSQGFPCTSPRLAADPSGNGRLVFEAADGIHLAQTAVDAFASTGSLFAAGGSSPRVMFDGTRYWLTYLDASGAVVIGYLDTTGTLVSTQVADALPLHDAYEVTVVGGDPWVISADASGYAGHHICLVPQS